MERVMVKFDDARRRVLTTAGSAGASLLIFSFGSGTALAAEKRAKAKQGEEKEVGAVEDLMREHGVIRRALLVYRESAARLRSNPGSVDPQALLKTAKMFRAFGEDYQREETRGGLHFPGGPQGGWPSDRVCGCAD